MQEKESIMVVRYELKILSLGITVGHHSASLVMPNSYPRNRIFNPHLTTIKDSYIVTSFKFRVQSELLDTSAKSSACKCKISSMPTLLASQTELLKLLKPLIILKMLSFSFLFTLNKTKHA